MKKFKFRLEALLKMKEHIEKEKQKEHALAVQGVKNQETNLDNLDLKKGSTFEHQRSNMTGFLSVSKILIYGRFLLKLKKEKLAGEEMLKALNIAESKKRKKLIEATKERKIFEKLKENKEQIWRENITIHETKEADEIAGNTFRLNRK